MDGNEMRNPWPMASGMTGLALFTLVGGGFFVVTAAKPKPVPAPKSFSAFKATDGSFACLQPAEWKSSAGGAGGIRSFVNFRREGARIEVSSDLAGSLRGDIAAATNAQAGGRGKPPVEKIHEAEMKAFERKYEGYQEMPAVKFQSPAGDARMSEFTSKGNFFTGKIHGYRATIMGGERRIEVVCVCPETEWAKLKPSFQRIMVSVSPGGG